MSMQITGENALNKPTSISYMFVGFSFVPQVVFFCLCNASWRILEICIFRITSGNMDLHGFSKIFNQFMTSTYLTLFQVFPRGRPSAFGAEPHLAEGLFRVRSPEAPHDQWLFVATLPHFWKIKNRQHRCRDQYHDDHHES